jgi:hypothetical protein
METAGPSLKRKITSDERVRLAEQLRSWYYDNGNGIYLLHKTAGIFIDSRDALLDKNISLATCSKNNSPSSGRR